MVNFMIVMIFIAKFICCLFFQSHTKISATVNFQWVLTTTMYYKFFLSIL